jgi:hypothetical protein
MTVSAAGGFNQSVTLSCSGAPSGSACSISPSSINPNGSTATAQVTVSSTARSASLPTVTPRWPVVLIVLLLLAGLAAFMAYQPARKRSPRIRLAIAIPAFALLLISLGCGSTGNNTVTNGSGGGTPAGSYNLTITASGGGQSHTSTITVIVK